MKIKRWLSAVIIVLLVVSSLGFIKFSQIRAMMAFAESFPEPSASVKSAYVKPIQHQKTVKVIGQAVAPSILTLSNEYPGSIVALGFTPGDIVEKDQLLIELDSRLDKANLKAASARLKLANSTYTRVKKLLNQKRISQDEVDKAAAEVAVAEAEVANLTTIIDKKRIKAPFKGRIGLTQYQVGQLLDANSQITTLVGLNNTMWIDFSVPQTLPRLNIGDNISVIHTHAVNDQQTVSAKVIAISPELNVSSRQQTYRAELDSANHSFHHNQMVIVIVPLEHVSAVAVPSNAITRNHFGDFVYRLEKDEQQNWRAKPVQVTLGDKVKDQQIVLSGLVAGDFIASEGAFKLKENLLVYTKDTALLNSKAGEL